MKKGLLILLIFLTACAPDEDVNDNTEEPVVAWGELSGIWQSYDGDEEQSHHNWLFIRDYGDNLYISSCYSPAMLSYPRDRRGNLIYVSEDPVGHVLSDSEIIRTESPGYYIPGGYHKIENSDSFKTGSLSLDTVSDDTGRHWSGIDDSTLCSQIAYYSFSDSTRIDIYTRNTRVAISLPGNSYTGSFTIGKDVYMEYFNYNESSLFVHNGTIDCELTAEENLDCAIDVSGFSIEGQTSASGKFTIYQQYLTREYDVIN